MVTQISIYREIRLLHGVETWAVNKVQEKKIEVAVMRILEKYQRMCRTLGRRGIGVH